jgi:ribosomal protein S7
MRIERANQEWKRPLAFLEKASLRWLAEANGQRAGWKIVLRLLSEIKALIQKKGTSYEYKSAPEAVAAIV